MRAAESTDDLLALARSRTSADRERLLLSLVGMLEDRAGEARSAPAPAQGLLSEILMSLVVEAEQDIRKRLAEKLASATWAPKALINILALDDIEIARPVIAASPLLADEDLVRLLIEATVEHQIEVAARPRIGPPVVAEILRQGEPAVMTALCGNLTAALSPEAMSELVAAARRIAALRAPLARHPQLTDALARQLYIWVGAALRQALLERFSFDPEGLTTPLSDAVDEAFAGLAPAATRAEGSEAEREGMELRLVAKLADAGQLRPGYLLRALREEKLSLFAAALATLGAFEPAEIRRALDSERPDLLALACAAVRIDRSVFPTLLELVRKLNGGLPGGGAEGARRAAGAFGPFSPDIARAAFRQTVAAV